MPDFLLIKLDGEIGLDITRLEQDLQSEEVRDRIENDLNSGIMSGVNGTPSFFINGSLLESYDESYESLLNAVLQESGKLQL